MNAIRRQRVVASPPASGRALAGRNEPHTISPSMQKIDTLQEEVK